MDRRSFLGALVAAGLVPKTFLERVEPEVVAPTVAPVPTRAPVPHPAGNHSIRVDGLTLQPFNLQLEASVANTFVGDDGLMRSLGALPPVISFSAYTDQATASHFYDLATRRDVPVEIRAGHVSYVTTAYVTEVRITPDPGSVRVDMSMAAMGPVGRLA